MNDKEKLRKLESVQRILTRIQVVLVVIALFAMLMKILSKS